MRFSLAAKACLRTPLALSLVLVASAARAQPTEDAGDAGTPVPVEPPPVAPAAPAVVAPVAVPPAPAPATSEPSPFTARLYGFMEEQLSATSAEPNGDVEPSGRAARSPALLDLAIPRFHIMAQASMYSRFRFYFNLAALSNFSIDDPSADAPIAIRNAWMEASIFGDYLNLRVGKLYRRFGLYNEIIDTSPSFIGVEVPLYVGPLRPMLTRTTNAMLHGKASTGQHTLSYAVTAGKDELSSADTVFSPGLDVNYDFDSTVLVGTSYYTTGGRVLPHNAPGDGSPNGGVAPWLASDRFSVYGGYGRLTIGDFLLHGEAWVSPHDAIRDPARVLQTAKNAEHFSPANRARMGVVDPNGSPSQVVTRADYTYTAVNVRAAYTFEVGDARSPTEITPFVDWEYGRDLESIHDQKYGGDGEPGGSPHGIVIHNRVGCVFKPVPVVAIKAEYTHTMYGYGSGFAGDEEAWLSLSYQWELFHK